MTSGEFAFWAQISQRPGWVSQYQFDPKRRWRFDFANPQLMLAVEIDGGDWQGHGRVWQRERDYDKHNEAVAQGWRILRGSTSQAESGKLLAYVKRCGEVEDDNSRRR